MSEPAGIPPEGQSALAAYSAGEISAEIALMRLLLAFGDEAVVLKVLRQLEADELLQVAGGNQAGLARTAALVRSGLTCERSGSIAAIREQFDSAAALAPEAAVALYSLGSPETLDRASAEIVHKLREWELVDASAVVLDIGSGIGRIERALASDVRSITGIDVSPVMIAEARRRCADLGNVEFAVCNGADLMAFGGQRFDLILAVDSFPYLVAADPAIAARHMADAAELLSPNGVLLILNYSYRGDLGLDRADLRNFACLHRLGIERDGTRDFTLWDGASFLLRKR